MTHLRRALEARPALVDQIEADVRRAIVVAALSGGAGGALVRELDRLARDLAFGQSGCPSRSPRRRGDSGRASRNPSGRRARPDPRAASVSTTLIDSTNSRQSIEPRKRRLPMVLLIETWTPACSCVSACTSCSIDRPDSDRHCSIQVSGSASAALCPCSRRASSATNELTIGGFERAMSAITRIRLFGSCSATSIIWSAHAAARLRSIVPAAIRAPTRRRFSISASRSMIGNRPQFAHLERRHRLVGRDETGQASPRRRGRRRARSPRTRGRRRAASFADGPLRQARKLAAVALGQVPLGGADLLFDQVEIVEQPFGGGRDAAVGA